MKRLKKQTEKILELLKQQYPDAKCELNYKTPFQLLVATILSAQTTDKKVNEVTESLFEEYPTVDDFLKLTQEELEGKIKKIGLYRNKSKNILEMCNQLKEFHKGIVPNDQEALMALSGVGRKTSNVVLNNAFGVPAIAVDTHVFRVANRIGLASSDNVMQTEKELQGAISKKYWGLAHHLLIFHGRRCCIARKPKCEECVINAYCRFHTGEG